MVEPQPSKPVSYTHLDVYKRQGERTAAVMIDPEAPDILRAIADRYLDINCSLPTLDWQKKNPRWSYW